MAKILHLLPGEKLYFEHQGAMGLVHKGSVDLYAITADRHERMFLLQREAGQYFFGLFDEFQSMEILVVAKEDSDIELYEADRLAANQAAFASYAELVQKSADSSLAAFFCCT